MRRRVFLLACAMAPAWGAASSASPLKPGPRDLCPVCGMLVAKYPNWLAAIVYRDARAHFFDGAKDFFKFLAAPQKYDARHRPDEMGKLWVTEFYGLSRIDARSAWYVTGSDVLGPMGHELVPLAAQAEAEDFMREHQGRRIVRFAEVTPELLAALDAGRFE